MKTDFTRRRFWWLLVFILMPLTAPTFGYDTEKTLERRYSQGSTHPYLSLLAVYLLNHSEMAATVRADLADTRLVDAILKGSIEEDFPVTRSLHHFKPGILEMTDACQWGTASVGIKKRPGVFSEAISTQTQAILEQIGGCGIIAGNNEYTFLRAIQLYQQGNKAAAYEALGHVMHLIQDMSVPAHVRGDLHPPFEPIGIDKLSKDAYELYCAEHYSWCSGKPVRIPDLSGLQPRDMATLREYFEELSGYTRDHFYSQDTFRLNRPPSKDGKLSSDPRLWSWCDKPTPGNLITGTTDGLPAEDGPSKRVLCLDESDLEYYASQLIPLAIQYSAGILVLFDRLVSKPAVTPPADPGAIDLIFCIDTTSSMRDDIDAVKAAATKIIERTFDLSSSARMALVAYRDYGDAYLTRGYAFTSDKAKIRDAILSLEVDGGGDIPEAVYEALLHAIRTPPDIGAWRDGVKKVVVLMGDAPPHTRAHTEAEVVKAAEEVDPAHIFPIAIAGASAETLRLFGQLAVKTGGVMGRTGSAEELPKELMRVIEWSYRTADAEVASGRVIGQRGDAVEIELPAGNTVRDGMVALVFSSDTPGSLVADGTILSGQGRRYYVQIRAMYGDHFIRPGGRAVVYRKWNLNGGTAP